MSTEQSAAKPNLIHQQQAEDETEESGHQSEPDAEVCMFSSKEGKGGRDAHGNQHHPGNSANAEDQQISNGPARIANGGQHQQRYGSRARKPVYNPHHKRPQLAIDADLAEEPIHTRYRGLVHGMRMRFWRV